MKCPGQDSRYWKPGAIFEVRCPNCGSDVEFFKDDSARKCPHCGHRFVNPKLDFGCASYCKYAEQCIGNLSAEMLAQRRDLLKDRVAIEMKSYFKKDIHRIAHANRVARYAERLVKELNADLAVALSAAYLLDVGSSLEEPEGQNDKGPSVHEVKGAKIAAEILKRIGAQEDLIKEVREIIGRHHHPNAEESVNFQAVYDAAMLVRLEERIKDGAVEGEAPDKWVERVFLTGAGKNLAKDVLRG